MSSGGDSQDHGSNMILVKKAWKAYSGVDFILRDLDMSVSKGQIYSLLGSSGVGKTTLLSCITGNGSLDAGHIDVNVSSRLQIGYMPQELALYSELTLNETFQFFAIMFYMSKEELANRVEILTQVLQLPSKETQISILSGGQQRRISVAVAMLKNPDLLILDEPTANLDALLKQSIWSYLHQLSKEDNKTVLLTTHYIEEARHSDKVGFMANGRILFEGSPMDALNWTEPPSERLEDVYYQLCYQESTNQTPPQPPTISEAVSKPFSHLSSFSFRRVMALFVKAMFYIRRNVLLFYVFMFSPAFMEAILSEALSRPRGIKLGYINYEAECSTTVFNCSSPLSCRYLENLRSDYFNLIHFDTVDEGKAAVKRNDVWGMVRFNWNFSAGVTNRLDYFYAAEHVEIAEDDEARVWLDMSAYPVSYMIKKHFYDSFLKSLEEWYTDCGWNTKAAHPIMRVEKPIYGQVEDSLISSGIPTSMMMMMLSTSIALGLIFVLGDRDLGTFDRCRVSGLKTSELVASAFLVCFSSLIPTAIAMLLIMYLYSGPFNAPILWATVILLLQSPIGILIGSVIGLMTTNLAKALQFSMGIMYVVTFLSGMVWPPEGAHWVAQMLYKLIPTLRPSKSLSVMGTRGLDVNELYWGLANSFIWLLIMLVVMFIVIRITERR